VAVRLKSNGVLKAQYFYDGAAWLARVTFKDAETEGLQLPLELKLEPGK
jgi:hypothetical protein